MSFPCEKEPVSSNGSLELLIKEFKEKLSRVESSLKINDVLHYSVEGSSNLRELTENVEEMKAMNEVIKMAIDNEKRKLERIKDNQQQLHRSRCRISRILCNLPDTASLPIIKKPQVPQVNAVAGAFAKSESNDKENQNPKTIREKAKSFKVLQPADFEKLPKHIKGHLSLEQINTGITEVNMVLRKKYEFLKRARKTLSLVEAKRRTTHLEMGKDLKGTPLEVFFMDSDVQRYGAMLKTKPRTRDAVFLILRHLGKLKEVKKGKPSRYCLLGG